MGNEISSGLAKIESEISRLEITSGANDKITANKSKSTPPEKSEMRIKRSLSDTAHNEVKRLCTVYNSQPEKSTKKTLGTFRDFMRFPKIGRKLTRSDLEQLVLQKVCEAVMLENTYQKENLEVRKYLQCIKKDVADLSKRIKYIEFVIISYIKSQNEENKVPLKIMRSVGVQVKYCTKNEHKALQRQHEMPTVIDFEKVPNKRTRPLTKTISTQNENVVCEEHEIILID